MRTTTIVLTMVLRVSTTLAGSLPEFIPDGLPETVPGFAVVELFTSEGCSSCPPADRLLHALAKEVRERKLPVYTLAFHVDYWNRLKTPHGVWVDPFSDAACTRRQTAYAKAPTARHRGVRYTPQFLINGLTPSRVTPSGFRHLLKRYLKETPAAGVTVTVTPRASKLRIAYQVTGAPKNAQLVLALVERGLVSTVTAGENAGKTLHHDDTVRTFAERSLAKVRKGTYDMKIPKNVNLARASIIAFVQGKTQMSIVGAARADLAGVASKDGSAKKSRD